MKNKVTITVIGIVFSFAMFTGGVCYGRTTVQPETETIIKQVVPDGYIKMTETVPVADINGWFMDKDDYLCFELGDIGKQLDDPENMSYDDICRKLPHLTELE